MLQQTQACSAHPGWYSAKMHWWALVPIDDWCLSCPVGTSVLLSPVKDCKCQPLCPYRCLCNPSSPLGEKGLKSPWSLTHQSLQFPGARVSMRLFTKLSTNCTMQNKGCGCPCHQGMSGGGEGQKICIRLRSGSFASLLVYSCKKNKNRSALGNRMVGKLIFKPELYLARNVY